MNHAILVTPHFLPSNLAGVQRVRIMSRALAQFGWTPIVVTVDYAHYEEQVDLQSLRLLPDELRVEKVGAWPAQICRRFGVGDVALRGQSALRRRVAELIPEAYQTLVFATVLPGYTSLVGNWAKRRLNTPFVLDYQDPWVPKQYERGLRWNKAGIAQRLARWLEPKVLPHVDALTAVSDGTFDTLRERNLIPRGVPLEVIPIGADVEDHSVARQYGRSQIERKPGAFHIGYLGTLTKRMLPAFKALLRATKLVTSNPTSLRRPEVHLHFIGTSAQPVGRDMHALGVLAEREGLSEFVHIHPARIGYLDALRTMHDADLLVLLGSTDSHYTASKLFPYWLSGKPILGLFHEASTVVTLSQELGGISLILYNSINPPGNLTAATAELLGRIVQRTHTFPRRNHESFRPYSAAGIAEKFARLFDYVCSP